MTSFFRGSAYRLIFALALLSGTFAWANPDCPALLRQVIQHAGQGQAKEARQALVQAAQKSNIPAFLKTTRNGDIPVVLLNHETAPKLKEFLDESIGTQIVLQPDWNNDHGMIRITQQIVDVDTPNARGFGEIHGTGIAWKPLGSYLARRNGGSQKILEVAYALTPKEREIANYYHRMRRAAVVRVKFTFGGARANDALPNLLQNGGEHCFIFCKGSALDYQISEIRRNIQAAGVANVDEYMRTPEVREFLDSARASILGANPSDARQLHPEMLKRVDIEKALNAAGKDKRKLFGPLKNGFKSNAEENQFINWIVGLDASEQYRDLLHGLNVTSDLGVADMNNARATAVLIYDSPGTSASFVDATYTAKGKFENWRAAGQKPLPKENP